MDLLLFTLMTALKTPHLLDLNSPFHAQQEYPKITRIQICDGASIDYMRVSKYEASSRWGVRIDYLPMDA